MSEQHQPNPEHAAEKLQPIESSEHVKKHETESNQPEHDQIAESLDSLRSHIETQAVSSNETARGSAEDAPAASQHVLQRELKADAYKQTLERTRSRLSPPARVFSRIAHQPAIEAISTIGEKTIARPSGLLAGSACALLGSAFLLYMTKHFGFTYNYGVFLICFVGGFVLGLLLEAAWHLLFRRHDHDS